MSTKLKDYISSGKRTDNHEVNAFIESIASINPDRIIEGWFRYNALLETNIKDIGKQILGE